jgi:hypothetical protein
MDLHRIAPLWRPLTIAAHCHCLGLPLEAADYRCSLPLRGAEASGARARAAWLGARAGPRARAPASEWRVPSRHQAGEFPVGAEHEAGQTGRFWDLGLLPRHVTRRRLFRRDVGLADVLRARNVPIPQRGRLLWARGGPVGHGGVHLHVDLLGDPLHGLQPARPAPIDRRGPGGLPAQDADTVDGAARPRARSARKVAPTALPN